MITGNIVSNSAWSPLVMLWCVMMLVDRMEAARPVIVVTGVMTLVVTGYTHD